MRCEPTLSGKVRKMKCQKCRFDNPDGLAFCGKCGGQLEKFCPKCNFSNPFDFKYCGKCGNALEELQAAPPTDYSNPQSYTPKFLADKILTTRSSIEGERKLVTVLFADVANFTSISEKLDPEEIHRIMDGCFKLLIHEIYRYEGSVTQFTGDGIMALFGAPIAHENHAQRACYAALSIREAMKGYSKIIQSNYGMNFMIRIGINSGEVIVGSVGDDLRMDYTALGDTTNVASRMETMAQPGSILVSGDTYRVTRDFFEFKPLGKVTVKGKEKPLETYALIEIGEVETRIGAALMRGFTKFVGRKPQLVSLKGAFEKAKSGFGQVVAIAGEAGVGKSRLVLEFRQTLADMECLYLEGRCFHFGNSIAYLPILDILRSYFNIKEGLQEDVAKRRIKETINRLDEKLHYVLPPFYELLSLTAEDEAYTKIEPQQRRKRTFESIRDLLIEQSRREPLVVAIEDLHWIDKTSEEFLNYLIGWLANARILLILLYRPEYTHLWGSKSFYIKVGLDQLSTAERNKLVESILQEAEVSSELQDMIIRRAGGNPLFIEELTCALQEKGYIKREGPKYTLSTKASEIDIPDTIQGIIAARIDRVGENLKRILQIASVIGRNFSYSTLQRVTGMEENLKPHLLELQRLEFIYEKSTFPELEYMFRHTLVQEVAYNSLLLRRRREIHEKTGNAIEVLYPGRLEEFYEIMAYHYSKSEDSEKAYQYLKLSGIKATRNSALWEAFRFYREAIRVLSRGPATKGSKKEQIGTYLLMASPMISLGFPEDSLQLLQTGERLTREVDTKTFTTFCSLIGLYYSVKGELLEGMKYGEECLKKAEETQDTELMAPIVFDLCSNYCVRGEFWKVIDLVPRVLTLLEETEKEYECFDRGYNIYSALLAFYGFSKGYVGDFAYAKTLCEKGLDIARKIDNLYSLGLVELLYGYAIAHQGEGKEALGHFLKSIQYLEKGQIFVLLGLAWSGLGWAHFFMGELQEARNYIEKGLKFHSEAGVRYNSSTHYWFLALVHYELAELRKAQDYVTEAIRLSRLNGEIYYEGLSMVTLGRILSKGESSQMEGAEDSILEGIKILRNLKSTYYGVGYLFLGELYLRVNQGGKALRALETAEKVSRETKMYYWLARTQAALKMLQGMRSLP